MVGGDALGVFVEVKKIEFIRNKMSNIISGNGGNSTSLLAGTSGLAIGFSKFIMIFIFL